MALGADCGVLLRRHGQLHHERRARVLRHGPRWRVLPEDGRGASQMANARLQPDRPGHLGRGPDSQRPLRPALYLRHVRYGALLHAYRDWLVHPALEAPRTSPPLPLHRIPVAARALRHHRRRMDAEHHRHTTHRSFLGGRDRADRRARIPVLETYEQEYVPHFLISFATFAESFASFAV